MTHYVTIRLTLSQAEALENGADVVRDQHEADGNKREARRYRVAGDRVTDALQAWARTHSNLNR